MVQLNCHWAPHRSQDNPHCMTSPPLTLPLYIPFLYSSLQFFSTSSLLPLSPHRSQDNPNPPYGYSPFDTPTLHSFSFLHIFLRTIKYCCEGAAQLPLCFPLYILNIVRYCDGTAQSLLGSPPVGHKTTLPMTSPL